MIDDDGRMPVRTNEDGSRERDWPHDDTGYPLSTDDLRELNLTEEQVDHWRKFEAPLGMTPAEYGEFTTSLNEALVKDGIDPAEVDIRLQGSSAQAFSGAHKAFPTEDSMAGQPPAAQERFQSWMGDRAEAERPARVPFDAKHRLGMVEESGLPEKASDYDIQLSSDAMVGRAREVWQGNAKLRKGDFIHPHYDFVNKRVAAKSFPALAEWRRDWEQRTGREVSPALFGSAGPPESADGSNLTAHFRDTDWIINTPRRRP